MLRRSAMYFSAAMAGCNFGLASWAMSIGSKAGAVFFLVGGLSFVLSVVANMATGEGS